VRTSAILQAGDELEQNAVDAVTEARLVPLQLTRVFLALVEQKSLHVVVLDRLAGQVEVLVAQRPQNAETLAPTAAE